MSDTLLFKKSKIQGKIRHPAASSTILMCTHTQTLRRRGGGQLQLSFPSINTSCSAYEKSSCVPQPIRGGRAGALRAKKQYKIKNSYKNT
jgi:hypothetical protein